MAAVAFAVGTRPAIPEDQAFELVELLGRRRTLAAQSAARKIRAQAARDPDRGETSADVDLEQEELRELAALLAEDREPEKEPAFAHLRDEIARELQVWKAATVTFVVSAREVLAFSGVAITHLKKLLIAAGASSPQVEEPSPEDWFRIRFEAPSEQRGREILEDDHIAAYAAPGGWRVDVVTL